MRNKVFLKINWVGLCENAWFPWQPVMLFSRNGVDLQINHISAPTYLRHQNVVSN